MSQIYIVFLFYFSLFLFLEAVIKFREYNGGNLPAKIIIYRDGVGEGQIPFVFNFEVKMVEVILIYLLQYSSVFTFLKLFLFLLKLNSLKGKI
jgi:hypothetical protein